MMSTVCRCSTRARTCCVRDAANRTGTAGQDLQITIAGKFAGQIEPGRRIVADVPLANLFRSLMLGMGASGPPVDEFGDNTGVLDELRE